MAEKRDLSFVSLVIILLALSFYKLAALLLIFYCVHYFSHHYDKRLENCKIKVCVIGGGFSGIGMAMKLKKMGIKYEVFEATESVGGTWHYNVYPGCSCDIPSHLYSFSYESNPYWSRGFPKQREIWEYLKMIVRKYRLNVRVNTRVTSARWIPSEQIYEVLVNGSEKVYANVVVYAGGALREPVMPDFPGQESFEGPSFHSSQWDTSVSVKGKTVAVIGTGASSVQIVPEVAREAKRLLVLQRTPCWCPPKMDRKIPNFLQTAFALVPGLMYLHRLYLFLTYESRYFLLFRTNGAFRNGIEKLMKKHIKMQVKDESLAKKLTPSFAMGCKRITPSDHYLAAFNKENVDLVSDKIERVTSQGLETSDGREHSADIIVYATGFYPLISVSRAVDVFNGHGIKAGDVVEKHPVAYCGITIPEFPNMFTLLGPNTGLGHNSAIWMIECQINYVADTLKKMHYQGIKSISLKKSVLDKFENLLETYMKNKVFAHGCNSWYRLDGGSGLNYALWPSHLLHYWWLTKSVTLDHYECIR